MAFLGLGRKNWMDRQPKHLSSAGVLLENEAGELLIVKANYKDYWTVPGGIIEEQETPRQAAVRETTEEVGLQLKVDSLQFVAVVNRQSSTAQTYQFLFHTVVNPAELAKIKLQTLEIDDYTFVSRQQVLSGDRRYAKAIFNWANNTAGYRANV